MKKYKLTKEKKEYCGITLYRIEALKDFGNVKKGQKGGWIEKKENLSQMDDCWVYDNALVSGDARVSGSAWVFDNAWVSGDAWVFDNAWVSGDARVFDNAQIFGNAWVSGSARVYGRLRLIGGHFYYYKNKSETIAKIDLDDEYELLCFNPQEDDFVEREP